MQLEHRLPSRCQKSDNGLGRLLESAWVSFMAVWRNSTRPLLRHVFISCHSMKRFSSLGGITAKMILLPIVSPSSMSLSPRSEETFRTPQLHFRGISLNTTQTMGPNDAEPLSETAWSNELDSFYAPPSCHLAFCGVAAFWSPRITALWFDWVQSTCRPPRQTPVPRHDALKASFAGRLAAKYVFGLLDLYPTDKGDCPEGTRLKAWCPFGDETCRGMPLDGWPPARRRRRRLLQSLDL